MAVALSLWISIAALVGLLALNVWVWRRNRRFLREFERMTAEHVRDLRRVEDQWKARKVGMTAAAAAFQDLARRKP